MFPCVEVFFEASYTSDSGTIFQFNMLYQGDTRGCFITSIRPLYDLRDVFYLLKRSRVFL